MNTLEAVTNVLTADIADIYSDHSQPVHVRKDKEEIQKLFDTYIKGSHFEDKMMEKLKVKLNPVGVIVFGSSATPLASRSGDLDLCVWLKPEEKSKREYGPNDVIRVLRIINYAIVDSRVVIKKRQHTPPLLILGAKVPIVKLEIYGYNVDISVHIGDCEPTNACSARLFYAYDRLNQHYSPLCCYVKEWFKHVVANDPKNSSSAEAAIPNSYTVMILVAQFLQSNGLLPNLLSGASREKFTPSTTLETDSWYSFPEVEKYREKANHLTLGVLLYRFIKYLSIEVNLEKKALDVESATFVSRESIKDLIHRKHGLAIVDFYDQFNPGRRVRSIEGFVDFLNQAQERIEYAQNPHRITERLRSITVDHKLIARIQREKAEQSKTVEKEQSVDPKERKKREKLQLFLEKKISYKKEKLVLEKQTGDKKEKLVLEKFKSDKKTELVIRETMNFVLNRVISAEHQEGKLRQNEVQ